MEKQRQTAQRREGLTGKEKRRRKRSVKEPLREAEVSRYQNQMPPETLEELTPEIRRQYFLWDEIFKREIELYPGTLFPLIKEIFGKEYPAQTSVTMLSTEYVVSKIYEQGHRKIQSIHSDLLVQVGSRDIYHIECQMKEGGNIALRMLEYDMNIALVHGCGRTDSGNHSKYKLKFPQSVILYLNNTKNTPDAESCSVEGPDGREHIYSVPVMKVQEYTPQMIADRQLNLLFPFLPIRFKNRFDTILDKKNNVEIKEKMEALKKDLTALIMDCIMILNREEENGDLERKAVNDFLELIGKACDHLFAKEPELLREVHEIMEPTIKLVREELEEQIGRQKAQLDQHVVNFIRQCREEKRSQTETEQLVRKIFSLERQDAKEKVAECW